MFCSVFVVDDNPGHMDVLPDDYIPDSSMPRCSEDKGHVNNNGLLLLDLCKQTGLRVMNGRVGKDSGVGKYTFVGSRGRSVVDYMLASQSLFTLVKEFEVHDPNILSDHCIISCSFEFNLEAFSTQTEKNKQVSGKYKWNIENKGAFTEKLGDAASAGKLHMLNTKIRNCTERGSINECLSEFVQVIDDAASGMFKPNKVSSVSENSFSEKNDSPWFSDECHEKRYNFLIWLDKYREIQSDETRINMVKARSEYKSTIRKCKYEYDKSKTQKLVQAKYKNAKLYWNMLKESSGLRPANVPLSSFEEYFKAVNNPADPFFTPDEDIIHFNERYEKNEFRLMFEELNLEFLEGDIERSIKQLKSNKSEGPDKIINEFLIHGHHILQSTICNLFNKIFDLGYFPEEWSEGYIIPLHKKCSINDVGNYRGITLLSVLGKLFTRVLNNRLSDWAENYFVLIEAQAGFRPGMSTTDNIFVLHGLITHLLNEGKKLYCAFVDFTKAFDYIVRENLWYKLIKYGLRGKILDIIKSMYTSVKSRVKYCNNLGNEFMCSLGVRQGECLSPLLFSLFLNDIEDEFLKSGMEGLNINMFKMFLLLYADDIIIFSNTAEEMQNSLNLLSNYCERWKLKVNVMKTKVMVFRKGGILPKRLTFYYNGETLEIVSRFKYLGVVFTCGGSFADAQSTLSGQAQKAIFTLSKYLHKFTFIPPKHKLDLFDKMILPILNYGSEVWGFGMANSIERVHLQFCKKLLGVKKTTQNDFIYGELGRTSCQTKRFVRIINYWFKILVAHETKYVKIVYNTMLQDLETLYYVIFLGHQVFMRCGYSRVLVIKMLLFHYLNSVSQTISYKTGIHG